MSHYCHQVSYTTDARKRLLSDPGDRYQAIRAPIEELGGHLVSSFFTLGPFDVLVISEFPQDVSLADIAVAFSQGGAIASIHTYPLLPLPEAVDPLKEHTSPRRAFRTAAAFCLF
ncbi:MAG TPA: GYD domain-containing protein [Candidatus Eisenbacteria bacterium]|nr:GYD domain-containing protein [Candidatus Eisenbacteria bacterium]